MKKRNTAILQIGHTQKERIENNIKIKVNVIYMHTFF